MLGEITAKNSLNWVKPKPTDSRRLKNTKQHKPEEIPTKINHNLI